jgi:hypothetical protein
MTAPKPTQTTVPPLPKRLVFGIEFGRGEVVEIHASREITAHSLDAIEAFCARHRARIAAEMGHFQAGWMK